MSTDYSNFFTPRTIHKVYGLKTKHSNSIYGIKSQYAFSELCDFVDRNITSTFLRERMFGNPLPKSYESLGNLSKNAKIFTAESLQSEINWTLLCVREHKNFISLFLEYRKVYENAFLIGDYDAAERWLDKIEKEICYSVWGLENRLLLTEFKESPEAHKTLLSEINKSSKGFFIPSLLHFISNRSEKGLSVSNFDLDLRNSLQRIKGSTAPESREFYYFKVNRFELSKYSYLKEVLTYEGYHSVIDRYLSLLSCLKISISSSKVRPETKLFAAHRVNYLSKKFKDPELTTLASVCFSENKTLIEDGLDLSIIDLYTLGIYDECISKLEQKLLEDPSTFEYYILYVKSFLLSKKEFKLPFETKCFQNNLLNELYQHLNRTIPPYESQIGFQRILHNLHSFSLANAIHKFINDEISPNQNWDKFDFLSLRQNNPELANFFEKGEASKLFLKTLGERYPQSVSIQFETAKFGERFAELLDELNLPLLTKKVEIGKYYLHVENYEKSKAAWKEVMTLALGVTPVFESAIRNLFYTYIENDELNEAISLYVENYIDNNFLTNTFSLVKIKEKIRRNKFKNVAATIDLPLFYTFSKSDENELHLTYEKFNETQRIQKPSDLKIENITDNKIKWVKFLHETCTIDIFKHSIYINGSKDRYEERILVCKTLLWLDSKNESIYKAEINTLTDAIIIQEGLQQLDDSKIYVNEQGLMNFELKEFEGLFNRYKTISNIYKDANKELAMLDLRGGGVRLVSADDVIDGLSKDQFSSDPLRDAFANIFDLITRKFLFSDFGIGAYLSTRIRHGALLGEIRPIFERHNLISQKDNLNNKYNEISFWNDLYSYLDNDELNELQDLLSSFSASVDNIIHNLIKDCLQIKTEDENELGWFDYYFDDTTLAFYAITFRGAKDFNEFIKKAIEALWARTDENLDEIRRKIQTEVKASINDIIQELSRRVQRSFGFRLRELNTSINTCMTDVQNALDKISGWFNRSGSQTSDFTLDRSITIVLQNISHSYTSRRLNVVKNDILDITIKGEYYTHFADLFRIFLDNALKHSDQGVNVINVEIKAEKDKDKLVVTIINFHPNLGSVQEVGDRTKADMSKLSKEGKSGLPKAAKILKSDLRNVFNKYELFTEDNNQFVVKLTISLENLIV